MYPSAREPVLIKTKAVIMKRWLLVMTVLFGSALHAQNLRLHVAGGMANYTGDIQEKTIDLRQAKWAATFGCTYDITDRIALRADYSVAKVGADDKKSNKRALLARNLNFFTQLNEFTLTTSYDFFRFRDYQLYVFGGVGVYSFNPYTFDSLNKKIFLAPLSTEGQGLPEYPDRHPYKTTQFNIPFGGGIKYIASDNFYIALEISTRKLFTDYLDDLSTTYADYNKLLMERGAQAVALAFRADELPPHNRSYPKENALRGYSSGKDGYYFIQLRASFAISWFDNSSGSGGVLRRLGCPSRF